MLLTPIAPRKLPVQDGAKVLLLAERWQRAAMAHGTWAEKAKECVDFMEGRQWTQEQLAKLRAAGRPAMTFNKTAPLVRLVLGYHINNRVDTTYIPGDDGLGTEQVGKALTQVRKQVSRNNEEPYVDCEVFLDGILGGRGFYDIRQSYEDNDLGETRIKASDPFSTYIDPDADSYDSQDWGYVVDSKMLSIDEIEASYGPQAGEFVMPWTRGETPLSPIAMVPMNGEVSPVRGFGNHDSGDLSDWWDNFYGLMGDFYDPYRKTVRVLDFQYWVSRQARVFIDLETGDKKTIPDDWSDEKIRKVLYFAQQIGNPLTVEWRRVKEVRWTTLAGDVTLYDKWSKYDHLTKVGYFPYFRRGQTRGMVEDLLDPQREVNKRRSAEIEIVGKSGNTGWKYHESSLSEPNKELLKRLGAMPGYNMEWKGDHEPKRIEPGVPPIAMEKLENKSADDLKIISSINESATGELDRVQSGRAVEARQRQTVIGVQIYLTNFSRSKGLVGKRVLSQIQSNYTEQRIFRIMGEGGKQTQIIINQETVDPATGLKSLLNDVTKGKYTTVIDERPLTATYANGQFEEMMLLLQKLGPALPIQLFGDLVLEQSTIANKEEWISRFREANGLGPDGHIAPAPIGPAGAPPTGTPPTNGGQPAPQPGAIQALSPAQQPGSNVIPLTR